MQIQSEVVVSPRESISYTVTLYKYISRLALIKLIREGAFKVTFCNDCNDPQEMLPSGNLPSEPNIYSDRGFISFSKDGNNAPMWGNYASSYCGACVKFEFPCFDADKISSANPEEMHILKYTRYLKEKGFNVNFFNAFFHEGIFKPSRVSRVLVDCNYAAEHNRVRWPECSQCWEEAERKADVFAWELMCTKDVGWSYEKEVRMPLHWQRDLLPREESSVLRLTRLPIPYIKQIILGPQSRLSASAVAGAISRRKKLFENADNYIPLDVEVIKARFSRYEFALNYTEDEEEDRYY